MISLGEQCNNRHKTIHIQLFTIVQYRIFTKDVVVKYNHVYQLRMDGIFC